MYYIDDIVWLIALFLAVYGVRNIADVRAFAMCRWLMQEMENCNVLQAAMEIS